MTPISPPKAKGKSGAFLWTRNQVVKHVEGVIAELEARHAVAIEARDKEIDRLVGIANQTFAEFGGVLSELATLATTGHAYLERFRIRDEKEEAASVPEPVGMGS